LRTCCVEALAMYAMALLCVGPQAVVSLVVGVRLLALARRTRRFPEFALSIATLSLPAVGYPSSLVAVACETSWLPGTVPISSACRA
jgi:hypothetical protein